VHHHRLSGLFADHLDPVDIQLRCLEINAVDRPEGAGQYLFLNILPKMHYFSLYRKVRC
jgi:hypothetical protein